MDSSGNFRPVRFLIRRAFKIWPGWHTVDLRGRGFPP